jgi:acetolactate synthase regulatory subunit
MDTFFFLKIHSDQGSLESIIEQINACGADIREFNAKRSLDQNYYLVRVGVKVDKSAEILKNNLNSIRGISQVDFQPVAQAA